MIRTLLSSAILAFFMMLNPALADDPIYTSTFSNKAVGGYDTVTYFDGSAPVKGSEEFQTNWRGADWYFSSQENLEKFKASPEKYAPQYGGYCAWATAHGTLAKGDPQTYTVEGGKLYLNYDKSIHEKWEPRKAELIVKGDEKYPDLVEIE